MLVLLVDDDDNKRRQLARVIRETLHGSSIMEARSFQGALRAMVAQRFDIAVLDMTLPAFDVSPDDEGGRTLAYGGRDLIEQLVARGLSTPAILVTQYDNFGSGVGQSLDHISRELTRRYPSIFVGSVFFDIAAAGWRQDLATLLLRSTGWRRS
jgi:CheY-like chemotaxis protein